MKTAEETLKKRAELYPRLKQLRSEGTYAVLKLDQIVVREMRR